MPVNSVQSLNASYPMVVTVSGMVTAPCAVVPSISILFTITNGFSALLFSIHFVPEKAFAPISVMVFENAIFSKLPQFTNAPSAMLVTVSGIVTLSKLLNSQNASSPMPVTILPFISLGIVISVTPSGFVSPIITHLLSSVISYLNSSGSIVTSVQ